MASVFGHVLISATIASCGKKYVKRTILLCVLMSVLPDFDVVSFPLGIPYESIWGHRGFTHSILFSMVIACIFTKSFYPRFSKSIFILLLLAGVSHSVLDALTNGGLGVAFFFPIDNSRYFFPFTPVEVSPIGIKAFFTMRGLSVILSELLWLGLAAIFIKATSVGLNILQYKSKLK